MRTFKSEETYFQFEVECLFGKIENISLHLLG